MTDSLHIVCPHCHTTNRVKSADLAKAPDCGSCHQALFTGHPVSLDEAAFDRHITRNQIPVLVDFWAPWCGPCLQMASAYEQAAAQLEPAVRVVKVDTEAAGNLGARFNIRSIPTLALFVNGRIAQPCFRGSADRRFWCSSGPLAAVNMPGPPVAQMTLVFRVCADSSNPFVGQRLSQQTEVIMKVSAPAEVFQRVVVEPAYKAVSAAIERSILEGALSPGAALPTEQDLAGRFGVHRSTVREAIRQVEQEGLLQRREGRRLFVCMPGVHDLAPRAVRLLLLQQTTFEELWEMAVTLEPLAARLAARHGLEEDLCLLEQNVAATAAEVDLPALAALDVEFHALVGRASHNRALMLAREPISLLYNPALLQVFNSLPQAVERNLSAHQRIVAALRQRDADTAVEWTRKHMVDFQRGFAVAGLDMSTPIARPN